MITDPSHIVLSPDGPEFVKEENPSLSVTTLCPPMIYGPPIHSLRSLALLNQSNSQLWKIISSGKNSSVPGAHMPLYVDVRDIAIAHVLSMQNPRAANQRYVVVGAQYNKSRSTSPP